MSPDILSLRTFCLRTFCPYGRFVSGCFVPRTFCLRDVLSLRMFCPAGRPSDSTDLILSSSSASSIFCFYSVAISMLIKYVFFKCPSEDDCQLLKFIDYHSKLLFLPTRGTYILVFYRSHAAKSTRRVLSACF
jgi:hypothetical protein